MSVNSVENRWSQYSQRGILISQIPSGRKAVVPKMFCRKLFLKIDSQNDICTFLGHPWPNEFIRAHYTDPALFLRRPFGFAYIKCALTCLFSCICALLHSCYRAFFMITCVSCLRASICLRFAHPAEADWKMETRKLAWSTLGSDAQASFQNLQTNTSKI